MPTLLIMLPPQTANQVAHLREKELNFYSTNIAAVTPTAVANLSATSRLILACFQVETMATLLAGFAFTAFVSMKDPLTKDNVSALRRHASGIMYLRTVCVTTCVTTLESKRAASVSAAAGPLSRG